MSTSRYGGEEGTVSVTDEKVVLLLRSEFSIGKKSTTIPSTEKKKRTESVMDEKFALLFWSEFSIGNGEFHYQVRYGREEKEQGLS
jgi:hypothetical protein